MKTKTGFVRSVVTRMLAIFIVVSVIITGVAFFSFTAEIRRSMLNDKLKQLDSLERTISDRMDAVTSIAYNIGNDSAFYFEPIPGHETSSLEMSKVLGRYLVGNGFIEHLAYCRTAEPDVIYTSKGTRSLSEFFINDLSMNKAIVPQLIQAIHETAVTKTVFTGNGDHAYFSYAYPLPQLAQKPRAHVLVMIPEKKARALIEALLINNNGEVAVFDADGGEIYSVGNPDDKLDLSDFVKSGETEEEYTSASGQKYVLQKTVSSSNRWTYVCVTRHSDTLKGLANKQLAFIIFVLLLLFGAITVMLVIIVYQYRPISKLAAQITGGGGDGDILGAVDERELLSDKIALLRDDSEQKHKYETAFYEAEAASKAKSAFLSSMSHDIRTPMNAIVGMTAIARKHIDDKEYVDDCLKKVQVSSDYLLDIINNVLDMSRIESGRIPIAEEPVLIPALVDSVVSLMTSTVEAKSQTLGVDTGALTHPAVLGDSVHIVQVFVNILSNAVKFTPEGGRITLRVREAEGSDADTGMYTFTFTDTGIGIPQEFIEHVFDTFSRANGAAAARTEGTGLGMAIAKKLVELMGGTIACESELGQGTTFTVTMPMKYADEETALTLSRENGRLRSGNSDSERIIPRLDGRRVLLVEDNEMNREIARKIIGETGLEVIDANDGREAVDIFSAHPSGYFDLILMDIQMPVMNGYEATAIIRSMDRDDAATVPIYAMTANTFDEDVRQVKDAGMNGHIGKPYNPDILFRILSKALL